jgi:ubiquinone/menaquinone biosynthesis C-methylase UbiE
MNRLERITYDVTQTARVAWFRGHYRIAQRKIEATGMPEPPPIEAPLPSRDALTRDLFELFQRDRANIAAGLYRLPHDVVVNPIDALQASRRFFADIDQVNRRRVEGTHQEVFQSREQLERRYPRYYLQNFHFQTDGWLSEHSAALYDFQVEVLFNGGADAMRRQALPPIGDFLDGRRVANQPLLDVASGTGRFLTFVKQSFPRLPVTALDLSGPYLERARKNLARWSWVRFVEALAEDLPFADESFALLTSVFLFHELPRKIRSAVVAEMARVLQPGGRLILVDSFQSGDRRDFEGLLELFPRAYHEPYFADYARHPLEKLVTDAGLRHVRSDMAFMSKVVVADKPARGG